MIKKRDREGGGGERVRDGGREWKSIMSTSKTY